MQPKDWLYHIQCYNLLIRMNRFFFILLVCAFFSTEISCIKGNSRTQKNQLEAKSIRIIKSMDLPADLKEISGISFYDENNALAIEDENGDLFFYNVKSQKITQKAKFSGPADYEDLAVVGNDVYIVDSKGKLFLIKDFKNNTSDVTEIGTPFTQKNNIEGLAYDAKNKRLLIAPKDEGFDAGKKKTKDIYEINLQTKQLNPKPVYNINLADIESYFQGDAIEESSKKFLKALGNQNLNKIFRTSALGINPKTNEIYVLSSLNKVIAVLSPNGKLKTVILLKGKEFTQPEGLAFTPSGELYISNEGRNKKGNIIHIQL